MDIGNTYYAKPQASANMSSFEGNHVEVIYPKTRSVDGYGVFWMQPGDAEAFAHAILKSVKECRADTPEIVNLKKIVDEADKKVKTASQNTNFETAKWMSARYNLWVALGYPKVGIKGHDSGVCSCCEKNEVNP